MTDSSLRKVQVGLAEMLKGGVIVDVTSADQAKIAEQAGACAVMALERVPSDIRRDGGVARMAAVSKIREVMSAVSIPVMAKVRIGHFVEAQMLEELGVDFIDESEVLTPADGEHFIDKRPFRVPFVCGCRDLGEALRRIAEGAALIRTKGEAGTGDVVEAVRHLRAIASELRRLSGLPASELGAAARELGAPLELVANCGSHRTPARSQLRCRRDRHPPPTPPLCMQLGAESVFVGSGIFKSSDPELRARAIVRAVTHYDDAKQLVEAAEPLGAAMEGIAVAAIPVGEQLQRRGA